MTATLIYVLVDLKQQTSLLYSVTQHDLTELNVGITREECSCIPSSFNAVVELFLHLSLSLQSTGLCYLFLSVQDFYQII